MLETGKLQKLRWGMFSLPTAPSCPVLSLSGCQRPGSYKEVREIEAEGATQGSTGRRSWTGSCRSSLLSRTPWNIKLSFISSFQLSTSSPHPHYIQLASHLQTYKIRDFKGEENSSLFLAIFQLYSPSTLPPPSSYPSPSFFSLSSLSSQ